MGFYKGQLYLCWAGESFNRIKENINIRISNLLNVIVYLRMGAPEIVYDVFAVSQILQGTTVKLHTWEWGLQKCYAVFSAVSQVV